MSKWLILTLLSLLCSVEAEWTHGCPSGCVCMWTGGRKTAECRDSGFTSIPTGLSPEVQILDLRGNFISTLRNYAFREAGLVNLQKLKLTSCRISRIDRYAFADLKILVELDLSENQITELGMDTFDSNDRLRELQLSDNPLRTLQGRGFPPLQHFQKLSLKGCQLSTLPPAAFDQLMSLEQLDLSGNQFQTVDSTVFQSLTRLKAVGLHDNPWRCDCKLKGLRNWALTNKLLGIQPTKCVYPDRVANFEWNQLIAAHFACPPEVVMVTANGHVTDTSVVEAVPGKQLVLGCLVQADPAAETRWVKDAIGMTNGTATANGKQYFVTVEGDGSRWVNVTLTKAGYADAGDYTCVGENKAGSAEKNLSLTFAGVIPGSGLGSVSGSVLHPNQSWIWILIICLGALLTLCILLVLLLCLCYYKKMKKTPKERTAEMKVDEPLMILSTRSKVIQDNGFDTTSPLLTPANNYAQIDGDPDYPDLLDLPRRHGASSPLGSSRSRSPVPYVPQTLSAYYRRPLELNPSTLYEAPPLFPPYHRPHSPFSGSVASFTSEPAQRPIVPPANRPGYVTLPRRPRINSWAPRPSPGPQVVKFDNLGARTTADGSSQQSLNQLDNNGLPPVAYPSSTLPAYPRARHGSARGPLTNPPYNFDPIPEQQGEGPQEGLQNPGKKVPPQVPPKPKKRSNGTGPSPEKDDGTEI